MKISENEKRIINQYGKHFTNTGGNDIIELCERNCSMQSNHIAALLQSCCISQIGLITNLEKEGIL